MERPLRAPPATARWAPFFRSNTAASLRLLSRAVLEPVGDRAPCLIFGDGRRQLVEPDHGGQRLDPRTAASAGSPSPRPPWTMSIYQGVEVGGPAALFVLDDPEADRVPQPQPRHWKDLRRRETSTLPFSPSCDASRLEGHQLGAPADPGVGPARGGA